MERFSKLMASKQFLVGLVILVMVLGFGVGLWEHDARLDRVQMVTNAQHQLTQISYHGKNGKNAFYLLQQHARVGYKTYSFGIFVTSIDGVVGNGPKYWTLFVNGHESTVGASAYMTKNSDVIAWKLQ